MDGKMFGINYFGIVDYFAVVGTLVFSLGIGIYYACFGEQTKEEMLVGGRSMSTIPIAISMMVTYLSAITIMGYPAEFYSNGVEIFLMTMMGIVFIPVSAFIFVKMFYNMKLTSVYEYLEMRFDSIAVRWLASFTFILQVSLINGVLLYAPAIALETILGLPVWVSITGIGIIGTVYTSIGGLKAVVWTDCFQFVMIAIGMVSILIRGFLSAGGFVEAIKIAETKGRLDLLNFTFDPFMRHNFWNFLFGTGFTYITMFGTHQPQVQRYSSLPSVNQAIKALLFTIPMKIFTMTIILLTGISVFAKYGGCCPILLGKIKKADAIIPHFVIEELSFIPGLMGIFVSCIFSAVLSSISSTLNSLAAVTWQDFLSHIPRFAAMGPRGQASSVRILALLYGILSIVLAFGAQNLGAIFRVVMTAVGATTGPLGGIFLCGLFMPCINKFGAVFGMLAGLCSMMFVAVQSFILQKTHNFNPRLPTDLDDCPEDTDFSKAINYTISEIPSLEWPEKMYTLSYILYPFIGAIITIVTGLIVSMITGGFSNSCKVPKKYLHPVMQNFGCCSTVDETMIKADTYKPGNIYQPASSPSFSQVEFITGSKVYDKFPYKYQKVSTP